jgi:HTH-type transcriptional regulator/antitoxin HipB
MKVKNKNLKSLDKFIDEQYGKKGTEKRNAFEKGYEKFKLKLGGIIC